MVAIVSTVAYLGLEARGVEVQCQIAPGVPAFAVVGLPDKAVAESRERVRAALSAIGLALPPKRITVNLSPADLPKEGSHYDLPIALALLGAMGVVDAETLGAYVVVGELGLDGRVAASPGVLLAALHAGSVDRGLVCPAAQGPEAAWAGNVEVLAATDLLALLNHFRGTATLPPVPGEVEPPRRTADLAQVKGQETAKRALEIAAAGGQSADERAAGCGQIADGGVPARHPARPDPRRSARSVDDRLGRGRARKRAAGARAALPRPASFGVDARAGRRRPARAPGRGQPGASGGAVSR